jgi:hypothetical protein
MSGDGTHRTKLARLADALIEDIIASPDADMIAEIDHASVERARKLLIEVKASLSRRLLTDAKAQLESWRSAQSPNRHSLGRPVALERFENIRRADAAFNQKMTVAARNGKAPTDADKEGLAEDLADLQRLDEQDTL